MKLEKIFSLSSDEREKYYIGFASRIAFIIQSVILFVILLGFSYTAFAYKDKDSLDKVLLLIFPLFAGHIAFFYMLIRYKITRKNN